jgi:hypothetical protein
MGMNRFCQHIIKPLLYVAIFWLYAPHFIGEDLTHAGAGGHPEINDAGLIHTIFPILKVVKRFKNG